MATSGGSSGEHDLDYHHQGGLNGFASPNSSKGSIGTDEDDDVFPAGPHGDSFFMTEPEPHHPVSPREEDDEVGPITPRRKIIGNGLGRPIHRQSLLEFENIEKLLKEQSQEADDDNYNSEERFPKEDGGRNPGVKRRSRTSGSGELNFTSDSEQHLFSDGGYSIEDDMNSGRGGLAVDDGDLMRYMEATPRNDHNSSADQEHRLSILMDNSWDQESHNSADDGKGDPVFPSPSQEDFVGLSQEKLPEFHSQLESEDGSEIFGNSLVNTLQHRDSLTTVIQQTAAKVETFGGDSPEDRQDGGGGVEHFKPIATSEGRPNRLPTAAQLRNKSRLEQNSYIAKEQNSDQSSNSIKPEGSVKSVRSQRTKSSRASTPRSVLSMRSQRSSRSSMRSRSDRSDLNNNESDEQLTPRSSTPSRAEDVTMVKQEMDLSPSPVKHDGRSRPDEVPELHFGEITGHSDSSSRASDTTGRSAGRSRLLSDEFVDQLQKEYDDLLQKYAQAENTIDQLRLGAKVNLYYDGHPSGQSGRNTMSPAMHGQNINLSIAQRGVLSGSQSGLQHTPSGSRTNLTNAASNVSVGGSTTPVGEKQAAQLLPDASEGKLLALEFQAQGLREQMDSFEILLQENQLTPAEQQRGLEQLKSGQAKLESGYMLAKEDHNTKARLGGGPKTTFDPESSVEGQIFQLGMRLEDLQETVKDNVRNNPPEPPPAAVPSTPPSVAIATKTDGPDHPPVSSGENPDRHTKHPSPEEEYALLLNRYNALKQLPPYPERDKEIQQLVKSLHDMPHLSNEMAGPSDDGRKDEAGFYDDEEDIAIDDVDGSSAHSSPLRETTSPDVFRPKAGSSHRDLPKWQPPDDGSVSSMVSPDNESLTSTPSRKKSGQGKSSSKQTPPRPGSGHRLAHPRGERGEAWKTRGIKEARHLEPDVDSGFVGSESSRQSQQTRGSGARPRTNKAPKLQPQIEQPKPTIVKDSRLPVRQQRGSTKTPLKQNETIPLRHQAVPEEEDSIYSGGSRRLREKQPQVVPEDHRRSEAKPAVTKPQTKPPPRESRERRKSSTASTAKPNVNSFPENRLPLNDQYLSRTSNDRIKSSIPKKSPGQRSEVPRGGWEGLQDSPPSQREFDGRSDVTRSSVRTEALQALQDEVNQLREKMAEARRHPPPIMEETEQDRGRRMRYRGDDDATSTRSSKSEMLQMLQEEIEDLKGQIAEQGQTANQTQVPYTTSTPLRDQTRVPYTTSTPLRDTIREVLKDRYIPRGTSLAASPIPTRSPLKVASQPRRDYRSILRSPPRASTYSHSYPRTPRVDDISPPSSQYVPSPEQYSSYDLPRPIYRTRTVPCPMCGGGGTHTHGEYVYPAPSPAPSVYNPAPPETNTSSLAPPSQPQGYPYSQNQTYPYQQTNPPSPLRQDPVPLPQAPPPQQPVVTPYPAGQVPQQLSSTPGTAVPSPAVYPTGGASMMQPSHNASSFIQQSETPNKLHPDARPVYLISGNRRGRYYVREDASTTEGEEELYYRKTPHSARGSSRHTPRTSRHQKVVGGVPADLQISLDDAAHMARRLKRTTREMVSSVRRDVKLAESFDG